MKTIVLVIGVVKKGKSVLLRKKPDGSPPYKETWYLFGGEVNAENPDPGKVLRETIKKQTGITIKPAKRIGWDTEIKPDHNGELTFYVYLDYLCEYASGHLVVSEGVEKLEWAQIAKLRKYDLVPPSKKLFKRMNYI